MSANCPDIPKWAAALAAVFVRFTVTDENKFGREDEGLEPVVLRLKHT
jgi:hypothetical protein